MSNLPLCNVTRSRSWPAAACLVVGMFACSPAGSDSVASDLKASAALGDAGLGGQGQALCGAEGEACCTVPLRDCAPGGSCNLDTGLCEPSVSSPGGSRLCRSASDCAATETCCNAGLISQCVELAPNAACPLPDLEISAVPGVVPLLQTYRIEPLSCNSGCLNTAGRHRTLGVNARVINRGSIDLLIGAPGDPGVRLAASTIPVGFSGNSCPEYSYAEGLVQYELIGADGSVYSRLDGRLRPGCLDGERGDFDCNFLGLATGIYSSALGCQELPLDGVAPGDYTLRFTIDPNQLIAESDESNNTFESTVTLSRLDAQGECPPLGDNDAQRPIGVEQECGWKPAVTAPCTPGEVVSLGCPVCEGDPILRVCAGSEVCIYEDAVASNDDRESGIYCPEVTFVCPVVGSYASFVGDFRGDGINCSITNLVAPTPPSAM